MLLIRYYEGLAGVLNSAGLPLDMGIEEINSGLWPVILDVETNTHVGILQANTSLQVPFKVCYKSLQYRDEWRTQYNKTTDPINPILDWESLTEILMVNRPY